MSPKKYIGSAALILLLISCWKKPENYNNNGSISAISKVWGYKPVYGTESTAKNILYSATPQSVVNPGNIYAFRNYIFQLDAGLGIHVIDNTNSSSAARIGFITVKGCSQISIKDDKIYTNSYDDLVVLDFSNLGDVHEYSRLKAVFQEYRYDSPLAQPPGSGYYECPEYNAFVVGWVKDSVNQSCYKN